MCLCACRDRKWRELCPFNKPRREFSAVVQSRYSAPGKGGRKYGEQQERQGFIRLIRKLERIEWDEWIGKLQHWITLGQRIREQSGQQRQSRQLGQQWIEQWIQRITRITGFGSGIGLR